MNPLEQSIEKPRHRGRLRARLGRLYYGMLRQLLWLKMGRVFVRGATSSLLEHTQFAHQTPLLRKLKDVDMQYQYNKIINLRIAAKKLNGVVILPGQIFSYWRLLGKTTRRKGYVEGMVLKNGGFGPGVGGGLCQMSNLIYWMVLHTPLTVIERHRHGYDVFPDSSRTQPFGSGATCFYPHGDLMIRNDTDQPFQLVVRVGETHLEGEIRAITPPRLSYRVVEKNHRMLSQAWGGYSRHNEIYRELYDLENNCIGEEFITANAALMMYAPFLEKAREVAE